MNGFIRLMCLGIATMTMAFMLGGCVGGGSQNDSFDVDSDLDVGTDTLAEADAPKGDAPAADKAAAAPADDFADFDSGPTAADSGTAANADSGAAATESAATAQAAPPAAAGKDDDLSLDDEVTNTADGKPVQSAPPPAAGAAEEDPFADPPAQSAEVQAPPPEVPAEVPPAPVETAQIPAAPPVEAPAPAPVVEAPAPAPVVVSHHPAPTEITGLRYQANESGGTVVVQANGPLTFTTRANPDLKQFIIEVENAHLPKKLTRSLNTKDIRGTIGTVDAYQNPGSNTARFVIQLREGASEPAVNAEGTSLLIASSQVAEPAAPALSAASAVEGAPTVTANKVEATGNNFAAASSEGSNSDAGGGDDKILPSQNLAEFMAGNTHFYGKKISIETNNMDVREALKFITDETGVNMVISDEVRGNLSLKLRQVPWDQALIMIMKARKLGYSRNGSVLRIAPLADLKQEEDDAAKLATTRKGFEPLKVRMFPVSYAKVEELEKKIKDFLSERGKAVGDARTNSLVVTDLEDNLSRVAKLIASLDTQPPQVLIEGKIVEANENFTRTVGVNWGASGDTIKIGNSKRGPVNMRPSLAIGGADGQAGGPLVFGVNIGTLDLFGNLSASLSLNEREDNVKVISSPRIVTLTNEKADITTTQEIPLTTITTVNGTTQSTVQFKPLTLKLEVTPQVTADASVIMNILVNRQFLGANAANSGDTQLPVNSREAKTKVLVRNGQTAVIGGIYQSDATESATGVPWFKDVPIVGSLFKTTDRRKNKVELLIFLTPRILGQNESNSTPTSAKDF